MMKLLTRSLLVAASAACLASSAMALNLVTNGGFESGLAGWNVVDPNFPPNSILTDAGDPFSALISPHGGNLHALISTYTNEINPLGLDGTLSQTLATTSGQQYALSFWLASSFSATNHLSVLAGGNTLLTITNQDFTNYGLYTFNFTASSNATVLSFTGMNEDSTFFLDDVSVERVGAVPEPITMTLGFAAAGLYIRRRIKAKKA